MTCSTSPPPVRHRTARQTPREMLGTSARHICSAHGTSARHICSAHGTYARHISSAHMLGTYARHICSAHGTYARHTAHMLGTRHIYLAHLLGTLLGTLLAFAQRRPGRRVGRHGLLATSLLATTDHHDLLPTTCSPCLACHGYSVRPDPHANQSTRRVDLSAA